MPRLTDKVAIVTGAAHGIGRAIAELFAEEGAWVLVADLDREAGEAVASGICESGGQAQFAHTDVTNQDDIDRAVKAAADQSGRIDVLVNNAAHLGDWLDVRAGNARAMGPQLFGNAPGRGPFHACRFAVDDPQ